MIKSKYNVVLIHGYKGNSENHWFPYIKENLEEHGVQVFTPQMAEDHTLEAWLKKAEEIIPLINEKTILVGHSLGCPFILHLLSKLSKPVFGTIFVAGFGKQFSVPDVDEKEEEECNRFIQNIAWKKARENAGVLKIFAGINDPVVPLDVSLNLGTMLKSPIRFIEKSGHFCAEDGFDTFSELLEYLLTQIYLTYEEFKKIDARVGHIKKIETIEGADKLLRFEIDFGEGEDRQIVSGIREYFPEYDSLVGKKALYVLNLMPRTIKGITSYGMLMAVDGVDGKPVFLIPEQDVNPGSHVR